MIIVVIILINGSCNSIKLNRLKKHGNTLR